MSNVLQRVGQSLFGLNRARRPRQNSAAKIERAAQRAIESLETRVMLTLTSLVDPFTGVAVDTGKWNITTKGLENNGPAGYNDPTEDASGLTLGGSTTASYWYGSSLESTDNFDSAAKTTVQVDRVSLNGSGSAYRSSLWLFQEGGQYLHFSQNIGESGWSYNPKTTGGGTSISSFNTVANDGGDHIMKLVYTPSGGTVADVDIYLDGNLGATAHFTNWDNTVPFRVIVTGQGRAAGDSVAAVFKDFDAESDPIPTNPPSAPTNLTAAAAAHGLGVTLNWLDTANNEINYRLERSKDNVNFTEIATIPAIAGSGTTGTYVDTAPGAGTKFYYRLRAFNNASGGSFSDYATANATTAAAITSLADPLTGSSVDTNKWNITNRGLENIGAAGYNDPTEDSTGLTLGGTAGNQYWYGSSLESKDLFSSQAKTTVTVDRVSLNGSGSAFRSSLWLLQPVAGGQFLHFAQDVNETQWEYNQTGGNIGTAIDSFNNVTTDGGDHIMKLVYTPLGGTSATVDMYLDGVLGATATFNNWDNSVPFMAILTGQGRATGDSVAAEFKDFSATSEAVATSPPAAPTGFTAAADASGVGAKLSWTDNADNEVSYQIERSVDGVTYKLIGGLAAATGTGSTMTFSDPAPIGGKTMHYRVRAFNAFAGGTFSAYATADYAVPAILSDALTGSSVDLTKWDITNRGLENNGPAGYNDPSESATGLTLGGTTNAQYWFGSSLESKSLFFSQAPAVISVDRVSLTGSGTAYRSSLWLVQPGGQFLHFSQNVGETQWQYNQTGGGSGTGIAAFNNISTDQGEHLMQLVYTPLGGTNAKVDMYLDGLLGATANFTNWDNSVPFKVVLTGQGRAAGDTVSAVFKDFSVAVPVSGGAPAAPTNFSVTADSAVHLQFTDNSTNEITFIVERSIDGTHYSTIGGVSGVDGTGTALTFDDTSVLPGQSYFYRVRAANYSNLTGNAGSSRILSATPTIAVASSLTDPLTGDSVDTSKWDITNRGLENNGPAGYSDPFESAAGLDLGGTANNQYWYGSSLESKSLFSSSTQTTVEVERVFLLGNGTAYRASLWLFQPGGQFLHFSQNIGEDNWQYNQTGGGGGTPIDNFNNVTTDGGDHIMKLVYTPLGGTNATVDMYLDGVLGATATFNNWDNSVPFKVILTGQARATGDLVGARFANLTVATTATPPLVISGTGGDDTFYIKKDADGLNDDVWINSATPGQGAPDQQIPIGQAGGVSIDGLGGNDKLILDYSAGNPIAGTGVTFNGGDGTDTVQVIGAGPTDAMGLFGRQLNHADGGVFTAGSDVEKLAISNANVATPSLTIGAGGFTGGVDIGVGGTLRVIYADPNASPASTIRGYLTTGRNGGTWNGPGISSSAVATHSGTAVGYADDGQTVKIMYTLSGDVDLDGSVGFPDLVAVAQHYGANGPTLNWSTGDVTYDNQVEFADLVAVAQNYGKTAPTAAAVPAAPVAAAPVVAASQAAPTRTATVPTAPVLDGSTTSGAVTPVITPKPVTISKPTPVVVAPVTIAKPMPTAKPVIGETATITPAKVQNLSSSVMTPSNVAAAAPVVATSTVARGTTAKPTSVFALQTPLATVGRAEALRGNVVTKKKSNTLFN